MSPGVFTTMAHSACMKCMVQIQPRGHCKLTTLCCKITSTAELCITGVLVAPCEWHTHHYTTLHGLHPCVQPVKAPSCTLSVTFPLHRCYSPYGTPPTPLSTVNMPAGCSHNNMTEQASLRQQHTHERREDTHSMLKRAPRMRIQEKVPSLKPSGAPLT